MPPFPQSIQVTIEFEIEHKPGTTEHLHQIARKYLQSKGVTYEDNVIKI